LRSHCEEISNWPISAGFFNFLYKQELVLLGKGMFQTEAEEMYSDPQPSEKVRRLVAMSHLNSPKCCPQPSHGHPGRSCLLLDAILDGMIDDAHQVNFLEILIPRRSTSLISYLNSIFS
jgi:hypothetical protein